MRKSNKALLCGLIVVMVAAIFSIPVKAANWQPVTTVTGSGSQTSAEFHIKGSEWRISWTYTPNPQEPSLTVFSFFVYPHGETAAYVGNVIKYGSGETSGTLSIHEGPKLYYIEVLAGNTPGYSLSVEYDADSEVSDSLLVAIIAAVIIIPTILIVVMAVLVRKRVKNRKLAMLSPPPPPPPPP